MLERIEGKVKCYKAITKCSVQIEFVGIPKLIELTVSESWVINQGDDVVAVGETDQATGKFIAYAYRNKSKSVFGKFDAKVGSGYALVIAGLFFFWGIFPLFTHVPAGLKMIALGNKVNRAVAML